MAEPLFAVRGLSYSYGPLAALNGVDLELAAGRFHGIVGPNGCGKTTLLDILIGARQPASGQALLKGRALSAYRRLELARTVALVPQEFALSFPFSVREIVLMGRHPHIPRFAAPSHADWEAVERAIALMELKDLAHKPFAELSGGEKQRAVLARALAQDAPALLLDEPTSHLDINHALAVLEAARRLVRQEGRSVVAVMHDLNLAAAFCDELVFMQAGRVLAQGPTAQALTAARLEEVFSVRARVAWDDFAGAPQVVFQGAEARP